MSRARSPMPAPIGWAPSSTPTAARCSWTKWATCRGATQTKLLRVLEENRITRVGDNKPIDVNVRVLSATNRRLEEAIADGEFREDLYYRLKVVTVELPTLAERPEDIVPLMEHFRRQFAKHHRKSVDRFSPDRAHSLLRVSTGQATCGSCATRWRPWWCWTWTGCWTWTICRRNWPMPGPPRQSAARGLDHLMGQPLDAYEKHAIVETLKLTNGNREEAARILRHRCPDAVSQAGKIRNQLSTSDTHGGDRTCCATAARGDSQQRVEVNAHR